MADCWVVRLVVSKVDDLAELKADNWAAYLVEMMADCLVVR